ncbi:hypothetical protein AcV5_008077 [Taiwanofungus camphoratus]|nr:hypothetical protein AcW2_007712 [Antrodia cinnamomea]KAI0927578.1 hypothetical protein AcV5_008077 [Antrodia cinnamomea]KAI0930865.1 hypothetical protein AcV7_004934 [Antrodia cinnamomea]
MSEVMTSTSEIVQGFMQFVQSSVIEPLFKPAETLNMDVEEVEQVDVEEQVDTSVDIGGEDVFVQEDEQEQYQEVVEESVF